MPNMTKKHYTAIAEIVKKAEPCETSISYDDEIVRFCQMCEQLADYFEQDNPKFKRDVFLVECGAHES